MPLTAADCDAHLDAVLAAMAGPSAVAREDQRTAVRALAADGRRVLVVQATGWGKSAVYWAATRARRAAGAGPTLVVSPLLALMRDQVDAATRAGLRAATLNSTNIDDWDAIRAALSDGELDVLLVSPERLASLSFAGALRQLVRDAGMIVIDEAHCISDWGFDFRPDYQRLARILVGLGEHVPVLATTATANARVSADVAAQLGQDTLVLRGSLARASLHLSVVGGLSAVERYAWVADALPRIDGSGIVYVLTVKETERLAAFLVSHGIDAVAYSGSTDTAERADIEDRLRANDVKAVVATSALGMGYDKADLAFCVHVGSPSSPIAYYQQVGRAGRGLDTAVAVLLPASTDERLWEYFATASIPDEAAAHAVLGALDGGPLGVMAIEAATGQRRGRVEAVLRVLAVDGAVVKTAAGWERTGERWAYDAAKYASVIVARRHEADIMRAYAASAGCLMRFLQQALDDPDPAVCGRCSVCTGLLPAPGSAPLPATVAAAAAFMRGIDVVIEPRKLWPSGGARKGRIVGCEPGRALAFADDPGWTEDLAEFERKDGPVAPAVLDGLVAVLGRWRRSWVARPVAVVAIPSRTHPNRVAQIAAHVASVGKLPLVDAFELHGVPPSKDLNSSARVAELTAALHLRPGVALPDGPVLLVDDTYRSGWTMTYAAALLRGAGCPAVLPLVVHQLP